VSVRFRRQHDDLSTAVFDSPRHCSPIIVARCGMQNGHYEPPGAFEGNFRDSANSSPMRWRDQVSILDLSSATLWQMFVSASV